MLHDFRPYNHRTYEPPDLRPAINSHKIKKKLKNQTSLYLTLHIIPNLTTHITRLQDLQTLDLRTPDLQPAI